MFNICRGVSILIQMQMVERSFAREVEDLRLGTGGALSALAITKATPQSGGELASAAGLPDFCI